MMIDIEQRLYAHYALQFLLEDITMVNGGVRIVFNVTLNSHYAIPAPELLQVAHQ